ncbi:MAG: PAS domain S-box protein [Mariprofundus sp.]|nr:PAS domain S-box protein [Mariprofundus sp.]
MNLTIADILTRNVCTIEPADTLAHAAGLMAEKRISCIVALEGDKPVGILTEADLVRIGHLHVNMQATTVEAYLSQPVISIATEQNVYEAFDFLFEHHVRHLVVVDEKGRMQGILTFSDILKAAAFDDFLVTKTIRNEMSRNIVTLTPSDSVKKALGIMDARHISCIVVVNADTKAIGMFSERDSARLLAADSDLSALNMNDVMSTPLITMHEDDSVLDASQKMHQHSFRRMVIVDNANMPIGILTQFDVIRGLEGKRIQELKHNFTRTEQNLNETQRLLTEKSELEQRYRSLFEESRDMMHIVDIDGCIIDVNRAELAALGYRREELIGKPVKDIICPESWNDTLTRLKQLMQGQEVPLVETALHTRDGKCIHVEISATPQLENGKVVAGRAILRDITERKRSNEALRASEARLDSLVQSAPLVIYSSTTEPPFAATFISPNITRQMGYTPQQFLNDPTFWATHIHPKDKQRVIAELSQLLKHDHLTHEYRFHHGDDSWRWMRDELRLIRDEAGRPSKIVGYWIDITERKQKENLLARRERQLAVLAEAGRVINEQLDELEIGRKLVNMARKLLDCDSGAVGFYRDDKICFREYMQGSNRIAIKLDFPSGYGVPGFVLETKRPYSSADALTDAHVISELQQRFGFVKLIDVPILNADGKILGCFEMHDRLDGRDFDEQDLEMIQSLSGIVASALVNAQQQVEIKQAARRMQLILDADFDAVVVHQDFNVVFSNTQAQQVFGYDSPQNMLGENVLHYLLPEQRNFAAKMARRAIRRGEPVARREMMGLSQARSEPFPMEIASTPIMWLGKPAVVSIVRDISDRKQAEAVLQEAHALHNQAQRIAHLGHWSLDLVHDRLDWSDEVFHICEIDPNKFGANYEAFLDIVHPNDRKTVDATYRESLATQQPYAIEHRLLLPDGRIKWLKEQCESEFDPDGKPLSSIGTVLDITQQRAQEQQLRLLESAVTSVNESIIIADTEGVIVYVNPSFTKNTGYSAADAIGKTPAILNSREQSKTFYQHFWKTIKGGKSWSGRILDRRKDGTIFPANLSVAPIFNAASEITHFVAVHEDLIEIERLQGKIAQAQKMEAVGIMAGGIAHDFNNMLASLVGNIYMLRRQHQDDATIVQRTEDMDSTIRHGADMIKQMLTFARKDHVEMISMELNPFFKEMHKMAQASLPENIKLNLLYDGIATWIHGSPTQLQQVIMNLIANAHHAVKTVAQPLIQLELNHDAPSETLLLNHSELISDQGWCCISCHDNGCGISPGNLEHIFEPFFTTREVGVGTGLGLAMAYGAVQSHRGIIDVQSSQGEGTTFTIYLPLRKAGKVEVVESGDYLIDGQGKGILIVDDNHQLREVLANVLRYNGFTVWEASDGEQALSQYKQFSDQLSLILMDIVMPNMGGVAAAQALRSMDAKLPIIFLTGYGEETQLHAASTIQHAKALSKPISMSDLIKVVEELIAD